MAEADPLKRVQSAARRASGPVSVETQRRWYQNQLHHDFGLDADGKTQRQRELERTRWLSGAKLLTILLLAAFASLIAFTVHLARDGKFDFLFAGEPLERPDLSWMGAAKEGAAAMGEAMTEAVKEAPAPPNFFEPDPPAKEQNVPSAAPSEEAVEPEVSEPTESGEAAEIEP